MKEQRTRGKKKRENHAHVERKEKKSKEEEEEKKCTNKRKHINCIGVWFVYFSIDVLKFIWQKMRYCIMNQVNEIHHHH